MSKAVMINILGVVLVLFAFSMIFSVGFSVYYNETETTKALLWSMFITFFVGAIFWLSTFRVQKKELRAREGFAIVALAWGFCSLFGTLPYLISGTIPSFTDAFFESVSGLTTTGASILTEIEALPKGILFWRNFTHLFGGGGIIVMSIAILPLLGIGGMQLFKAETSGPAKDKLSPRLRDTAKILLLIYFGLVVTLAIILMLLKMSFFDALCHSFAAIATGGFSPKNLSIAFYDSPAIEYTLAIFMFLSGVNFTLHYKAVNEKKISGYLKNEEFLFFTSILAVVTFVATVCLVISRSVSDFTSFEKAFRDSLFQVVTMGTSTGYATDNYENWPFLPQALIFILLFLGPCAGSTGGGLKQIRILLLFKHARNELRRLIHPNAVILVRLDRMPVSQEVMTSILSFFMIYMGTYVIASLLLTACGLDFLTAFTAPTTCLSGTGPAFGSVGNFENFGQLPSFAKYVLSACMIMGRVELYTILILFSRTFWKN